MQRVGAAHQERIDRDELEDAGVKERPLYDLLQHQALGYHGSSNDHGSVLQHFQIQEYAPLHVDPAALVPAEARDAADLGLRVGVLVDQDAYDEVHQKEVAQRHEWPRGGHGDCLSEAAKVIKPGPQRFRCRRQQQALSR